MLFALLFFIPVFSRRILEENEPDYYSGWFFFRQITECIHSGHFLQNRTTKLKYWIGKRGAYLR